MHRERGTKASINTQHVKDNLDVFKQLHPGKIIAVVKADAYGHGLERVVPALQACDAFAVATIDEALELRYLDASKRIILLEGVFNEFEMQAAVNHSFDVVLHQDYQLDLLAGMDEPKTVDVWLKIDSGMNRLGFKPDEAEGKITQMISMTAVNEIRLMSHFASSDDVGCQQTINQQGINEWLIDKGYEYSLSNTGAVLNHLSDIHEWARVGIGLYGISPLNDTKWASDFGLKPAMRLTAKIIASKHISAGSLVGYGGQFKADTDMRIGIVGIGYADGYPWSEHSSRVVVDGQTVNVLGRVSMDMIAIDLTGFEQEMTGSEVVIWGDELPIERVASDLKMIPYALTCGITKRVKFYDIQ